MKGNQVHGLRRHCVQLSQHRGDLSTMIGAVIAANLPVMDKKESGYTSSGINRYGVCEIL
jgi:hypothetical protein